MARMAEQAGRHKDMVRRGKGEERRETRAEGGRQELREGEGEELVVCVCVFSFFFLVDLFVFFACPSFLRLILPQRLCCLQRERSLTRTVSSLQLHIGI